MHDARRTGPSATADSCILTGVVAKDGVGVVGRQLRTVEPSPLLFAHVRESSIVRRKERVPFVRTFQCQLVPRSRAFHVLPYLQQSLLSTVLTSSEREGRIQIKQIAAAVA